MNPYIALSYVWKYLDVLNGLGVVHKCDRQTDGRTDGRVAFGAITGLSMQMRPISTQVLGPPGST